jgi:hypothetical protein
MRAPWRARLEMAARGALIDKVPRDHDQPDHAFHRRRVVVVATLVIGASLLGVSLSVRPGAFAFYPLTFAVAVTWIVGGLLSGPLYLGCAPHGGRWRRPIVRCVIWSSTCSTTRGTDR